MDHKLIGDYIRAGFAGLYMVTHEEIRAEAELITVTRDLDYKLFCWSLTTGILDTATGSIRDVLDPLEAINAVSSLPEKSILVLKDFHQFLGDSGQPASPMITRTLKEKIRECRTASKVILVIGCTLTLPPELEKDFTVIHFDLPTRDDLWEIARGILSSAKKRADDSTLDQAADAARGLTATEAEDILALSVVRRKTLAPELIAAEKAKAIAKNGILEIVASSETLDSIGGLDDLKGWMLRRKHAFSKEAKAYGLPTPKGVLILGIPGTGKSLTAKAASSALGLPLLRLDAGKLFAGLVGESEANLRRAIQTADAIAPAIMWIDEIDKGMSGSCGGRLEKVPKRAVALAPALSLDQGRNRKAEEEHVSHGSAWKKMPSGTKKAALLQAGGWGHPR